MVKHKARLTEVKPGKGPAVDVYRQRGEKPVRFRYGKSAVMHEGKLMRQRYGFKGKKLVEIGFVPITKNKLKKFGGKRK
jgi:hypothetical protein